MLLQAISKSALAFVGNCGWFFNGHLIACCILLSIDSDQAISCCLVQHFDDSKTPSWKKLRSFKINFVNSFTTCPKWHLKYWVMIILWHVLRHVLWQCLWIGLQIYNEQHRVKLTKCTWTCRQARTGQPGCHSGSNSLERWRPSQRSYHGSSYNPSQNNSFSYMHVQATAASDRWITVNTGMTL